MRKSLFGLDEVSPHDEGQAYLCTIYDPTELPVILGILDGAKIPVLVKDRGAGGVSRVIMGFSLCGTDLFVPEAALEEALRLISTEDTVGTTEEAPDDGAENDGEDRKEEENEEV